MLWRIDRREIPPLLKPTHSLGVNAKEKASACSGRNDSWLFELGKAVEVLIVVGVTSRVQFHLNPHPLKAEGAAPKCQRCDGGADSGFRLDGFRR